MNPSTAPYRRVPFGGSLEADVTVRDDGSVLVVSREPLGPYPDRLGDAFLGWAARVPERTLVARRVRGGDWRRVSYAEALGTARSIAQALLDAGVSAERPIVVLSGNDLEHFLIALGALLAGVPYAPISPAYSLVSEDFGKLRHIVELLTPALVYASDPSYGRAIDAVLGPEVGVVLGEGALPARPTRSFAALAATPATATVDAAHTAVGPDTIAKFLFTSGSTRLPKGVINTHRMLCSNQQMLRQCFPSLATEPPVLVDWLPWNHTFGANHNVGIVLSNGGTLYIDDGKPTPSGMAETLRNLREIAPTIYFNVPKGFEEIANALELDPTLRRTLFSRVEMFFYSGAGLAQPVWDKLERIAVEATGERIRMLTGLGMTETSPFAICANAHEVKSGHIGLPAPGVGMKLVPVDGKMEVRYRGPNVTPGYWRAPEQTAAAFDADGWFRSGDAARPMDPSVPGLGFVFDGRIAEDFKLSTGTFVSVGPLRARVITAGDPYVMDAVVAGLDRDDLGLLIFPRLDACRTLAGLPDDAPPAEVLGAPAVHDFFQRLVDRLWADGTGSATRVARACVLAEAPSIDRGEITDKGSINQRAVLTHRAAEVERLYAREADGVIRPSATPHPPGEPR